MRVDMNPLVFERDIPLLLDFLAQLEHALDQSFGVEGILARTHRREPPYPPYRSGDDASNFAALVGALSHADNPLRCRRLFPQ